MYLPCVRFSADSFPSNFHLTGTGHGGFNLDVVNPNTFPSCAGYLTEEAFNVFMELCDGYGMTLFHTSTRWGIHIPNRPDVHCVVFYYDGRYGQGFAVAFRKADGFSDLWYLTFDPDDKIPF